MTFRTAHNRSVTDDARMDDGYLWPTAFAEQRLVEATLIRLIAQAVATWDDEGMHAADGTS